MPETLTTPSTIRSLYVHVPYCHTICGYCDFYSEVLDRRSTGRLVDALLSELATAATGRSLAFETVFVGGGTPTTLPIPDLERLLRTLQSHLAPAGAIEFTVEANPATVSPEVAGALVACGVTRASVGAQSFDPGELRVLERIHKPAQVAETIANCRAAGIRSLNLDLIFAVPGQSLDSWLTNLRAAIELEPDHLSCYGLTYERGTPLFEQLQAGKVQRIDPDLEADMYEATIDTLATAGFEQYEVSNFARPGHACRHNLVYWRNEPCLGIGPSAAGLVDGLRYKNVPDTAEYARCIEAGRLPRISTEKLTIDQAARETAVLGLRLRSGIDRNAFRQRFRHDVTELFDEQIRRFSELGLIELTPERLHLTRRGLMVADSVMAEFV